MSTGQLAVRKTSHHSNITLLFQAQKQLARELDRSQFARIPVTKRHPTVLKQAWISPTTCVTYSTKLNQKEATVTEIKPEEVEVQQLAAIVVPNCSGSNIIVRIDAKRKLRHGNALKDFYAELTNLGRDLEKETMTLATNTQNKLNTSRRGIRQELHRVTGCMDTLKEKEVMEIWESNDAGYLQHQIWIQEFRQKLWDQEDYRIAKSIQLLRHVHKELLHVGYESAAKIHNRLNLEALTIDKAALSNRQRISSLCCHLTLLDLEAQKLQYLQWKMKKQNWIKDTKLAAVKQYKNLLESLAIGSAGFVSKDAIRKFRVEEHYLCLKRVKLLNTVREVKPPCTQYDVTLWLDSIYAPAKKHEELVFELKSLLTTNKDTILKQCKEESQKIKHSLVNRDVCSPELADKILQFSLPPVAEEYLLDITMYIERIVRQAEYQKDSMDGMQEGVYTKLQTTVKIWESHQDALASLKDSVQYKVDNIQNELEITCQDMEKSIAAELDSMREENSKSGLTTRFSAVSTLLEDMRKVYIRSHKSQMKIVRNYPKQAVKELNRYRQELEKFFGPVAGYLLDSASDPKGKDKRNVPLALGNQKASKMSVCTIEEFPVVSGAFYGSTLSSDSADRKSKAFKLAPQTASWHSINLDDYDLGRHPGGSYSAHNVLCSKDKKVAASNIVTTQSEPQIGKIPKHEKWLGFETRLQQLHRIICINFAAHWENWARETTEKARCESDAKALELSNELELRLRLHAPRQGQIEDSVVRLRAAELVYHADRVKRHIEGVSEELTSLQKSLQMLRDQQGHFLQKLDEKLQETEAVCASLGFSGLIEENVEKMRLIIEKHIENHKDALKKFRNDVNEVLTYLRHSNGTFSKSFKNFQNQGNFSDEEASVLTEQLNRVYPMITSTEYTILTSVQQLENECLQGGLALHRRIDSKFSFAVIDADFVERLQRWFTNTQVKITAEVKVVNLEDAEAKKISEKLHKRLDEIVEKSEAMSFPELLELISQYRKVTESLVFRGLRLGILKPSFLPRFEELAKDHEVVKLGDRVLSLPVFPVSSPAPSEKPPEKAPDPKPTRGKSEIKAKQSVAAIKIKPAAEPAADVIEAPPLGPFRSYLKSLLNSVNIELMALSEQFYRQKGDRGISCPDVLAETFDQCAKDISTRLKSYWDQIEAYFQQCVCDYLEQLQALDVLLAKLCKTSFPSFLQHCQVVLGNKMATCHQQLDGLLALWQESETKFMNRLRPRLGHPKAAQALQTLKREEDVAFERMKTQIKLLYQDQQEVLSMAGQVFIHQLVNMMEQYLKEIDNLLSTKDLRDDAASLTDVCLQETISGRLRRLLQAVGSTAVSSTSVTDAPTPVNGLPYLDWEDDGEMSNTSAFRSTPVLLITRKTPNHVSVVAARDAVYTSYKEKYNEATDNIRNAKEKKLIQVEKWHTEWLSKTKTLSESYSLFYPMVACCWQQETEVVQ